MCPREENKRTSMSRWNKVDYKGNNVWRCAADCWIQHGGMLEKIHAYSYIYEYEYVSERLRLRADEEKQKSATSRKRRARLGDRRANEMHDGREWRVHSDWVSVLAWEERRRWRWGSEASELGERLVELLVERLERLALVRQLVCAHRQSTSPHSQQAQLLLLSTRDATGIRAVYELLNTHLL